MGPSQRSTPHGRVDRGLQDYMFAWPPSNCCKGPGTALKAILNRVDIGRNGWLPNNLQLLDNNKAKNNSC
ncbi:hypothetical protein J6590_069258 [Homalodisca vitripennis]|nr:hypothetical protein J6590_069258 [Homalodisca vitripennis]